ncbi:uncharacterized protein LOC123223598 isoform X2 [Mangifera indica]|uniref:uncharacterized protein LOC123223598 isoform X2 n=1 Tax=Mangifera indica TaxID=29780 RepID=UPI001CFAC278|nr:uncharacterized protein LOC123223598 isoform X2 [Mangifera indica]
MIVLKKEEEMELELGLSIGGGFKRSEKVNHIKRESVQIKNMNDQRTSCFNTALRDNHPKISTDLQLERMGVAPQVKREKKRPKKQHHEGKTKSEECLNGGFGVTHDNKMWLKSPKLETRELEFDVNERDCKKSRVEDNESRNNNVDMTMKQVNLNFTVEQNINNMNQNVSSSSNPTAFSSPTVCPVLYPYLPIQFVQLPNGLPYPCVNVVPIWGNGVSKGSEQNSNVVQSLVNQSFRPFQSGNSHSLAFNVGDGCVSDQNGRKAGSRGSPMGSPSIVSDYQSSSNEGGSSETRSHSNNSLPDQRYPLHGSKVSDKKGQSEHIASSPSREAAKVNDETTNSTKLKNTSNDSQCSRTANCAPNCIEKKIASNNVQLSPTDKTMGGVSTTENQSPGVLKESKRDISKPPKPQIQNQTTISLPQMPCVSTTGNGPDGKTINGFLYRYSKLEVSIICVCHGTSFSPAEFVQHAGGRDVSNPLKHITVIPSAF